MTRRDRAVRHALAKLAICERYAREARLALLEAERAEAQKPARVSGEDRCKAERIQRLDGA